MSEEASFCPNCGHRINANDEFCPNCGYKLTLSGSQAHRGGQQQAASDNVPPRRTSNGNHPRGNKKMKPLTKVVWIVVVVLVVALIGGYFFGRSYYSKTNQVDRVISAMKNDQEKRLAGMAETNDPNFKISGKAMKPTINYYASNKDQLSKLRSQFMRDNDSPVTDNLQFKQDGNAWLIFPRYKLMVKPVYSNVSTNLNEVSLSVNGKQVTSNMGAQKSKKIGPLAPGLYNITTSGKVNGRELHNNGQFDWIDGASSVSLPLRIITFTVKGQPGSDVLIQNKKVGTISDNGDMKLSNYPFSTNMNVQVQMKGKSGKLIASKPYSLKETDDNNTIEPKFDGIAKKDQADQVLHGLWTDASGADNGVDLSKYFDGGNDNPACQDMLKMVKSYNDNDKIDTFDTEETTDSVAPYDSGETQVTYHVDYTFYNDDNGVSVHHQTFEYNAILVKKPGSDNSDDLPFVIKSNQSTKKVSDSTDNS